MHGNRHACVSSLCNSMILWFSLIQRSFVINFISILAHCIIIIFCPHSWRLDQGRSKTEHGGSAAPPPWCKAIEILINWPITAVLHPNKVLPPLNKNPGYAHGHDHGKLAVASAPETKCDLQVILRTRVSWGWVWALLGERKIQALQQGRTS